MGRDTRTVVITSGRDEGKTFVVTEMAARPAHAWATRAIFALLNAGADIPGDIASMGVAGLAMVGLSGIQKVQYEIAHPLLEELLACAQCIPDANRPDTRVPVDRVVEDFPTFFKLQQAAYELLTSRFTTAAP